MSLTESLDAAGTGTGNGAAASAKARKRKSSSMSGSDVESVEFKFPSKGDTAFIAEEEDFGPVPDPPDYAEVGERNRVILLTN